MAITADERPQLFLASLREKGRTNAEKLQSSFSLDIFDNKRFQPDNIVRMVLTVIAHDPTLRRAQYFLRLFRYLVPHLYNASNSARIVLRDGVDALANIITSKMAKKDGMLTKAKPTNEASEPLMHEKKMPRRPQLILLRLAMCRRCVRTISCFLHHTSKREGHIVSLRFNVLSNWSKFFSRMLHPRAPQRSRSSSSWINLERHSLSGRT